MLKKLLVIIVIFLGGSYAAAEFAAASYVEKAVAEAAKEKDPLAQQVEASVSKPLLFKLIQSSEIDRMEISTTHVKVGPIVADRATAIFHRIQLDVAASIREREPVVKAIGRLEMIVEISAGAASAVLPDGFVFEFHNGGEVVLKGGGAEVKGTLSFVPPATLRFEPSEGRLPPGISPQWTFEEIPFVTCLESLQVEEGVARVSCSQDNPPAQFPPSHPVQ